MPFYEIAYETGRISVACYADDAEALSAVGEQHRRATVGEPGGPLGAPAERVARVFVYDKHPNEYNPSQGVSVDVVTKEVAELIKALADENGVVAVNELASEVRALTHPMNPTRDGAFGSVFRMKEAKELKLDYA